MASRERQRPEKPTLLRSLTLPARHTDTLPKKGLVRLLADGRCFLRQTTLASQIDVGKGGRHFHVYRFSDVCVSTYSNARYGVVSCGFDPCQFRPLPNCVARVAP